MDKGYFTDMNDMKSWYKEINRTGFRSSMYVQVLGSLITVWLCAISFSCQPENEKSETVIGIIPFGNFDLSEARAVQAALRQEYDCEVVVLPSRKIPRHFFVDIKSPRYRADSIIAFLRRTKPDSLDLVLGLTNEDISVTKREEDGSVKKPVHKYTDFGVFGYGYLSEPGAVVSSFRIKSKSYSSRLQKISIHEIGHNLGLGHCIDTTCLMADATEKIATIDHAGIRLCDKCKAKLK